MINASNNTPASNRKKYMDVFGGKSNQKNSQGSAPSEEIKQETNIEIKWTTDDKDIIDVTAQEFGITDIKQS